MQYNNNEGDSNDIRINEVTDFAKRKYGELKIIRIIHMRILKI